VVKAETFDFPMFDAEAVRFEAAKFSVDWGIFLQSIRQVYMQKRKKEKASR